MPYEQTTVIYPMYAAPCVISLPEYGVAYMAKALVHLEMPGLRAHQHQEIQVFGLLSGRFEMQVEGQRVAMEPGSVMVIPARFWHQVLPGQGDAEVIDLRLSAAEWNSMRSCLDGLDPPRHLAIGAARLNRLVHRLVNACESNHPAETAALMARLWQLLGALARNYTDAQWAALDGEAAAVIDVRVKGAERYLLDHSASPIGVEDIAGAVNLSRSRLNDLYQQNLGVSPGLRLRQVRVSRAAELLKATQLSIKEISQACGFSNPNQFGQVFHRLTGQTPTAYRRAHHEGLGASPP